MNVIQEITNVILNAPPNATVPFWNIKPIQFNKIKILIKNTGSFGKLQKTRPTIHTKKY